MPKITLRENESFDSLLQRFKTSVKKSETLIDYRKHEYFLKKSLKRKVKSVNARKKLKNSKRKAV